MERMEFMEKSILIEEFDKSENAGERRPAGRPAGRPEAAWVEWESYG